MTGAEGAAEGPLVFVHVPKTAGTSFREALELKLGAAAIAGDYGPKASETSPLVRRHVFEKPDLPLLREELIAAGVRIVCGHVPVQRYAASFGTQNLLVIVRDPVQRLVSEYEHFRRHNGEARPFPEVYRSDRFINHQYKLVSAIEPSEYGFIGLTERYAETVAAANRRFGWKLPVLTSNVGRPSLGIAYQIDPDMEAEVRELNRDDIDYYERMVTEFERRQ
jgi:hypothetical protein